MIVIRHQHERVQSPAVGFDGSPEPIEPPLPVGVVRRDGLSLISPRHHVVERTGKIDPQGPCHAGSIAIPVDHRKG